MKKLLKFIIVIVLVVVLLNACSSTEQTVEEETKTNEGKNAGTSIDAITSLAKSLEIGQIVDDFLEHYNGKLPVYASHWQPIAEIEKEDWSYAKTEFSNNGTTYKDIWTNINQKSNKYIFKRGFRKKSFDSIRNALRERAYW